MRALCKKTLKIASRLTYIVARLLLIAIIILVLLGGVVVSYIHSTQGRDLVARQLSSLISQEGMKMTISTIRGSYLRPTFDITLNDQQGTWLQARDVSIQGNWWALRHNQLHINALSAKSMQILRQPVLVKQSSSTTDTTTKHQPFIINIDALDIQKITLSKNITGYAPLTYALHTTAHYDSMQQQLQLPTLTLQGSGMALDATAYINLAENTVQATSTLVLSPDARLPAIMDAEGSIKAQLQGTFLAPSLTIDANLKHVTHNQKQHASISMQIHSPNIAALKHITLNSTITAENGTLQKQPLVLFGDVSISAKRISLHTLNAKGVGVNIQGAGTFDRSDYTYTGTIDISAPNLAAPASLMGLPLDGALKASIRSTANTNLQIDADVKNLQWQRTHIHAATLSAKGNTNNALITLEAKGVVQDPFMLSLQAEIHDLTSSAHINIPQCKLEYALIPIHCTKPITASFTKLTEYTIHAPLITINNTSEARFHATRSKNAIDADIHISALSLNILPITLPAALQNSILSLTTTLRGTAKMPVMTTEASLTSLSLPYLDKPATLVATAQYQNAALTLKANIANTPAERIAATLSLPAHLDFDTFSASFKDAIQGTIIILAKRGAWEALLTPEGHTIQAGIQAQLSVSGTLNAPQLHGDIMMQGLEYQHEASGFHLPAFDLRMHANGQQASIADTTIQTGERGTLTLAGQADWRAGLRYHVTTQFHDAHISFKKLIDSRLNGTITLTQTERALLQGNITFGRTSITLPQSSGSYTPPALNIPSSTHSPTEKPSSALEAFTLDLAVSVPGKMFIRGMGVNTEIAGDIQINGTAANPKIEGTLNTIRGTLDVLGKSLRISEGSVRFNGKTPPTPYIKVSANRTIGDVIVQPELSGTPAQLSIKVKSTPPRPQEEAISLLLFGKAASALSPVEAVQLANNIRNLTTSNGGFDPLGSARDLLNVDSLRLEQNEATNDMRLGVGTYIRDDVYLELQQGTGRDSGSASIEVELTPNLSLESKAGQNAEGNIGLKWKEDY